MKTEEQKINEWYAQFKRFAREKGIDLTKKEDLSCIRIVLPKKNVTDRGEIYYDIMAYIPNEDGHYKDAPENISLEWKYDNIRPDESKKMKNYLYNMAKENNLFISPFNNSGMGIMVSVDKNGDKMEAFDAAEWGERNAKYILPENPGMFNETKPKLGFFVRLCRAISKSFFKETYEQYERELRQYNEHYVSYSENKANYDKMQKMMDAFSRELTEEWIDEAEAEENFWKDKHFLNDEYYKKASKESARFRERAGRINEEIANIAGESYKDFIEKRYNDTEAIDALTVFTFAFLVSDDLNFGRAYKNYTSFVENMMCRNGADDENYNVEYSKEDIKRAADSAVRCLDKFYSPLENNGTINDKESILEELQKNMRKFTKLNKLLVSSHNGLDNASDFYMSMIGSNLENSMVKNIVLSGRKGLKKEEKSDIKKYSSISEIRDKNNRYKFEMAKKSANYQSENGKTVADMFSSIIAEKILGNSMKKTYSAYVSTDEYQKEVTSVELYGDDSYKKEFELQEKAPVSELFKETVRDKSVYDKLVEKIRNSSTLKRMVLGNDALNVEDENILEDMLKDKFVDNPGERCYKFIEALDKNENIIKKIGDEVLNESVGKIKEKSVPYVETMNMENINNVFKQKVM